MISALSPTKLIKQVHWHAWRTESSDSGTATFLVAVRKYCESNLRDLGELGWARFGSPHSGKDQEQLCEGATHTVSSQETGILVLNSLPPFYPAHRMLGPSFRASLSFSTEPFWKHSLRSFQNHASLMLTLKINYPKSWHPVGSSPPPSPHWQKTRSSKMTSLIGSPLATGRQQQSSLLGYKDNTSDGSRKNLIIKPEPFTVMLSVSNRLSSPRDTVTSYCIDLQCTP